MNYADSAPFAPTTGKLREIRNISTPKLRTIFTTIMHLVIAHTPLTHTYLHIPRLVSHYYVLSEKPVFLKCQLCHFRTIALIDHN